VVNEKDVRIGVFVCHCGLNIAKSVDCRAVREYASKIPGVVYAVDYEFMCSETGQAMIKDAIKNYNLNRVVVASCSPRLHEITFRRVVAEAGLNPFLFEMANLREHCSWPHMHEPEKATSKAKHLVRAAVERSKLLEVIGLTKQSVKPSALVIGAGIAGIQAALTLADYGFDVHLVERQPYIGGKVAQLGGVFPTEDCGVCIAPRPAELHRKCMYKAEITSNPRIKLYTQAVVKELEGYIGNFKAKILQRPRCVSEKLCISCGLCENVCPITVPDEFNLGLSKRKAIYLPFTQAIPRAYVIDLQSCNKCGECVKICPTKAINLEERGGETEVEIGTVIVATGFEEFRPNGLYGYGKFPNVITQLELARMLDPSGPTHGLIKRPSDGKIPNKVVMIQCVGSRDKSTHLYCSKICCMIALKHAKNIKSAYPNAEVVICYKDIRLAGKDYETYYTDCQEMGVKFIRGDVSGVSEQAQGDLKVTVKSETLETQLDAELLVLTCGIIPSQGTDELAKTLNLSLGPDGFLSEAHIKLAPIDTKLDGIYLCGTCVGPKDISETVTQATAAASRAAIPMMKKEVEIDLARSVVDEALCVKCKRCEAVCPYKAIKIQENGIPYIIEVVCKGCGTCVEECPVGALQLRHFKDQQLYAAIDGILAE
jgi:heterodisulfide reductase subunit A